MYSCRPVVCCEVADTGELFRFAKATDQNQSPFSASSGSFLRVVFLL